MHSESINIELAECNCNSDSIGHRQLTDFYHRAKLYNGINIHIIFSRVNWFDANLCALFGAIIHLLQTENGLTFSVDREEFLEKFEVLHRNGFFHIEGAISVVDDRYTTLPYRQFSKDDKNGFIQYIDQSLMNHRGMPTLEDTQKAQIKDDLIELMSNVNYHSNTNLPFFVCGQYYPKLSSLKFTMVDLGEGFLPKINKLTEGVITTDIEAISWALSGKSTKPLHECVPGGLGIKNIYNFCKAHGGFFSIATGKAYWSTDLERSPLGGFRLLPQHFVGCTINLHFKH